MVQMFHQRLNCTKIKTASAVFGLYARHMEHKEKKPFGIRVSKTSKRQLIHNMVRMTGLEPAHLAVLEPKSSASANSATSAY